MVKIKQYTTQELLNLYTFYENRLGEITPFDDISMKIYEKYTTILTNIHHEINFRVE